MNSFSLLDDLIFPGAIIIAQILAVLMPVLISVAFLVYAERKVLALIQLRRGPNVVGPFGFFQIPADGLKFLFKEIIIPDGADKFVYFSIATGLAKAILPNGENAHCTLKPHSEWVEIIDEMRGDIPTVVKCTGNDRKKIGRTLLV